MKRENHQDYAQRRCAQLTTQAAQLRAENWLSQREVSTALGLTSHANLSLMEQGKTIPRLDHFLRILSVLGYTLAIVPKENP